MDVFPPEGRRRGKGDDYPWVQTGPAKISDYGDIIMGFYGCIIET